MAVINPSALVSEIRGSVGDQTFSKNHYGQYVKAKLTQTVINSVAQIVYQEALADGVAAWQNISEPERKLWQAFSDARLRNLRISRNHTLAAFNEMVKRYLNRAILSSGAVGFSPFPDVRLHPAITNIEQDFHELNLTFTSLDFTSDCDYALYATPPLSPGITNPSISAYKLLEVFTPSTGSQVRDIYSVYNAMFDLSTAAIGAKIFFYVKAINSDNFASSARAHNVTAVTNDLLPGPPQIVQTRAQASVSGANISLNFTTPPEDGQLIILICQCHNAVTYTPPSGFTSIAGPINTFPALQAWWKIASGESGTYTIVASGTAFNGNAIGYTIIGFDPADPIGEVRTYSSGGTNVHSGVNASGMNVATNSLVIAIQAKDSSNSGPSTVDEGFANQTNINSGSAYNLSSALHEYPSGDTGLQVTWTVPSSNQRMALILVEILVEP